MRHRVLPPRAQAPQRARHCPACTHLYACQPVWADLFDECPIEVCRWQLQCINKVAPAATAKALKSNQNAQTGERAVHGTGAMRSAWHRPHLPTSVPRRYCVSGSFQRALRGLSSVPAPLPHQTAQVVCAVFRVIASSARAAAGR